MKPFAGRFLLKWTTKLNIVIWAANFLIFILLTVLDHDVSFLTAYFSKALLLETGIAFLVGGILAFSSSALQSKAMENISKSEENWSIDTLKIGEKRANKYLLLAIILFIQSIIISILGY